jgi:ABC-type transport system involved in multi-copper enzyme maturation permease subunit
VDGPLEPVELSDLAQWWVATESQLRHHLRTYRFFGLLAFIVGIALATLAFEFHAGAALVRFSELHSASEYLSDFLVYSGLIVVLAAAFFGGDALSQDFSSGTGYFTLVQPVHRSVLLAGRYASATLASAVVVGAYYLIAVLGAISFFPASTVPWGLLGVSFGLALLYTLSALAVAFTLSAFFRTPAIGVLVTVLVLYVGFTTLQSVAELGGLEPWWSFSYAGGAIAEVLDTDFIHYQAIPVGANQTLTVWTPYPSEGAVVMLVYLFVFLGLSIFLYETKESTG